MKATELEKGVNLKKGFKKRTLKEEMAYCISIYCVKLDAI